MLQYNIWFYRMTKDNRPIRLLYTHMVVEDCVVGTVCAVLWIAVTSNEVLLTNTVAAGVIVGGVTAGVVSVEDMVTCVGDTCAVVVCRDMRQMEAVGVVVTVGLIVAVRPTDRQTDRQTQRTENVWNTHKHKHTHIHTLLCVDYRQAAEGSLRDEENNKYTHTYL